MWTCKECGYKDNRETDVYCGRCGEKRFKKNKYPDDPPFIKELKGYWQG